MMETNSVGEAACTQNKFEEIVRKHELNVNISNGTTSTESIISISDSATDTSSLVLVNNDLLEGTLYRTHVSETKVVIEFLTNRLYESFQKKVYSDYASSVEIDPTSFISKCTTHVKGAICHLKLDSHFKSVELSGLGSKIWREERFPKIAQSLFKHVMEEMDSQLESQSQREYLSQGSGDSGVQQSGPICDELHVDSNDVNAALNCNVALSGNVALDCNASTSANVTQQTCNVHIPPTEMVSRTVTQTQLSRSGDIKTNKSFTAENITELYMQQRQECQPAPMDNGISTEFGPVQMPIFTSTPIAPRQDISAYSGTASSNIFSIIGKIDRLESGIKAIKNEILHQMECKLNELRTSVVNMIENVGRNKSYADVSRSPSSVQVIEQHSLNGTRTRPEASYIDEGYGDQSGTINNRDTSQTNLKTPYTPVTTDKRQSTTNRPTPQPIPVHTTNRNTQNLRQSTNVSHQNNFRENTTPRHNRTLIIGDSILKGINIRGLKNGIKICTRSGAKISDIWEEISVYDLKSFSNIIICVGGNDCSSKVSIKTFEESYDQLIGFIKSANKNCTIYLSKIVPRGDTDVAEFNNSIQRLSDHWTVHQVKCIDGTSDLFFGQNGLPSPRYYTQDGIHLSNSGTKRLLDAFNRHVDMVSDHPMCVQTVNLPQQAKCEAGNQVQGKL